MNVRYWLAITICVFCMSRFAIAQEFDAIPGKAARVYVLLLPGKGSAILKPISGIEEIPFRGSCLSFREISCLRENGETRLFAIDAQLHFRGRTKHADRIELLLGDDGVTFNGVWELMPSNADDSLLYSAHHAKQSDANASNIAHKWMILDQKRIFRDQLARSSNAIFPSLR